ncbi:NAD(P)H-binding protein [Halococcoides cellulosivorans]|uniref:NADH-binding protein n=1 Tax=Halococcoides cellulosivorans TaxID=1679096 RepID=A0A2R4X0G6_9EURY|nr:NAD(P)H-binding protein [Halococcoides cellulosivorans]AWB27277.1 NADH-binding protein [Halococcoides cellulosivorans]
MTVLVTGATGFVGGRLVPALVDHGLEVRALTRDASGYDPPDGVRAVEGDLLDPDSLDGVFDGVETAYYLVHSMGSGPEFAERDRRAAANFVAAAESAGVERIVYLGGLGETGAELSEHLQSRREVESVLASGTPRLTTLRAAIVVGAGSVSFRMIRQLAGRLPIMITPKWVRTPCQPIAISDVIAYLVGVLDAPETAGETYEIGGPDVLTYQAMMEAVASQLGRDPIIVPVPVLSPSLSAYWVELVTDVDGSVARPLIRGVENPVVVTDDRIRSIVDVDLTPFDDAVATALSEADGSEDSDGGD